MNPYIKDALRISKVNDAFICDSIELCSHCLDELISFGVLKFSSYVQTERVCHLGRHVCYAHFRKKHTFENARISESVRVGHSLSEKSTLSERHTFGSQENQSGYISILQDSCHNGSLESYPA